MNEVCNCCKKEYSKCKCSYCYDAICEFCPVGPSKKDLKEICTWDHDYSDMPGHRD